MSDGRSAMAIETAEAPAAVARLLAREGATFRDLGRRLAALGPPVVATCARGSSDHAAGFFKYACELTTGVPVASIGPSVASVYGAPLRLGGSALLTISQSGMSPDLVALQDVARRSGALTVALVNDASSPVAAGADVVVPLHAGPEKSVAATKSFLASAVAAAALVAAWSDDRALSAALDRLPAALAGAAAADWSAAMETFAHASSMFVVGRGPAYPIAQEAALKGKETASVHAEAHSLAEVMHGPLRLVGDDFPILGILQDDASLETGRGALRRLAEAGGRVFSAGPPGLPGTALPLVPTGHGLLDPLSAILSFYVFVEAATRARGHDPDSPRHISKVTETR